MNFPSNVKYTEEHEWIRVEGDIAYVGITDYAQEQLGDIVFVDITTEGETLEKGEVFGTIEVVKTISDLFLPVAGEVLEQNESLADNPELVNQDPYGKGWLVIITQIRNEIDKNSFYSGRIYGRRFLYVCRYSRRTPWQSARRRHTVSKQQGRARTAPRCEHGLAQHVAAVL